MAVKLPENEAEHKVHLIEEYDIYLQNSMQIQIRYRPALHSG